MINVIQIHSPYYGITTICKHVINSVCRELYCVNFILFLVGRLLKNHCISFPSMWCFVNCIFLFFRAGTVKKFGKNQVIVPQTRVARSISVKDVISVLEREPQMSKSPLIYRLYERNQSDSAGE
jgi:hypothetical protein